MFLPWGIWFVFGEEGRCTAVCPGYVWVRRCTQKGQGVLTPLQLSLHCCAPFLPLPDRECTWSLQSKPVTWTDSARYSCILQLKNWICPPPLPALLHSVSDSGMQALSYTAQWRFNVTISKASAGKKTLTSGKLGWGFALAHSVALFWNNGDAGMETGLGRCHWESILLLLYVFLWVENVHDKLCFVPFVY